MFAAGVKRSMMCCRFSISINKKIEVAGRIMIGINKKVFLVKVVVGDSKKRKCDYYEGKDYSVLRSLMGISCTGETEDLTDIITEFSVFFCIR